MMLVLVSVIFREAEGDTGRYYQTFLSLRGMSFSEVLSLAPDNKLFFVLNWILGQFGSNLFILTAPIAIFCTLALSVSIRKVMSSYITALMIFIYSMYPFFVFYINSGMKQALAMAFLFMGFVFLFQKRRLGWLWLLPAPLFHSGSLLIFPFLLLHFALFNSWFGRKRALWTLSFLLLVAVGLSITNLNTALMAPIQNLADFSSNYDIYFADASDYNYRTGFRWDFTLFSLLPLISYVYLQRCGFPLALATSGWWLSLYLSLSIIYQLFAFAPYADRFAAFAWFILPFVLMLQCVDTGSRRIVGMLVGFFVVANILLLQFYTGPTLLPTSANEQ